LFSAEGLTSARLFRSVVSLIILALLMWFLLGVLEKEIRKAEQQSAQLVLNQLRAALVIKGAEVMLTQSERLEQYEGLNPFELVEHQWRNYAGRCHNSRNELGTWCFRQKKQKETVNAGGGWLIYTANQPITLQGRGVAAGQALAWTVTTDYADRNKNGRREQDERSTGLRLVPVSFDDNPVLMQDARH